MVRGLNLFREHFSALSDRFVLIGGTACDLILEEVGIPFRATKDLDIVLCIESVDAEFAQAFWAFVKTGGYRIEASASGRRKVYRFQKPSDSAYPAMLELFSRTPDALPIAGDGHLTPIPINDEISSLSAILLDEAYYSWIQSGRRLIEELPVVAPTHLIPLKVRAWLDLRTRKEAGEEIGSRSIQKHKNDVFRLFQVIDPETDLNPPRCIVDDMRIFLDKMATEEVNLEALGLRNISVETLLEGLRKLYGVDASQSRADKV